MEVKQFNARKYTKATDEQKLKAKEKVDKLRKDGSKLVKGMFEFLDAQGGWLEFAFRIYPGEPVTQFKIVHGEIIEIPMDVVKHLNNCMKKVRQMPSKLDENGRPLERTPVTKISRTRFTPVDMM